MKKRILLLMFTAVFISCKNDKKSEETVNTDNTELPKGIIDISGNFMYYEDAAVFQTKSELYGVISNDKLEELIIQSETLKDEPTDEVAVELKVKVSKKPENEEGWDKRIEIIDIVKVTKVNRADSEIIKLGKEQEAI